MLKWNAIDVPHLAATIILVAAAGSILFIVSDGILGSHVIR